MSTLINVIPYKGYTINAMAFEDEPDAIEYWVQDGCRHMGDANDLADAHDMIDGLVEDMERHMPFPCDTPSLPDPWWAVR
jgi:hypothetical protein